VFSKFFSEDSHNSPADKTPSMHTT
jgi:hypothetical protein